MPYRTFLLYNAAGALVWGTGATLLGYFAGASYQRVAQTVGRGSAGLLVLLVLVESWSGVDDEARGQVGEQ